MDRQDADPDSLLNATRALLAFRRRHPALVKGEIRYHPLRDDVICLERDHRGERLLVALNFTDEPRERGAPHDAQALEDAPAMVNGTWQAGALTLPAYGIAIARCPDDVRWTPTP